MISLYAAFGAMFLTTSGGALAATGPQPAVDRDVAARRDDDERDREREARRARREAEARRRRQGADPGESRPAAPSPRDPRR